MDMDLDATNIPETELALVHQAWEAEEVKA
jgi:hypothetical protein